MKKQRENIENEHLKAWVVTANMGLGHQRAAYPLAHLAFGEIITADNPRVIGAREAALWRKIRKTYEFFSRVKEMPLVGGVLFGVMNGLMKIPHFYPLRDLSKPALNNHLVDYLIKKGLGRELLRKLSAKKLPMISTFYIPSLVADYHGYEQIYTVICDADLNRVWVATKPYRSKISYFAPCGRVMRRLRGYGVSDEKIFITGFPLPKENIGGPNMEILKADLLKRLGRLDPKGKFTSVFGTAVETLLGEKPAPAGDSVPVTVTFAVGGAGAQVEIGRMLAAGLREGILDGRFRLKLVAGASREAEREFVDFLIHIGLWPSPAKAVEVICSENKYVCFDRFSKIMRETDILWTKPSELSFYSALGIPIVMAPAIGTQEDKNQKWLMDKACALPQYRPLFAAEWLKDMLDDGVFAEKALNGFVKNRKLGIYKIEEVLKTKTMERETDPLKR